MQDIQILIVEDEKKIADSLSQGLRENSFQTQVAYDGNLGLSLFKGGVFQLVILDINLPRLNGYDLCRMIRDINPAIPVIMLTAMSSVDNKIEGFDAGAVSGLC